MRVSLIVSKYSFIIIVVILLSACGGKSKKVAAPIPGAARPQMVMNVDGYIVKTEPFAESIEVPGSIIANETTEIHPEVSGEPSRVLKYVASANAEGLAAEPSPIGNGAS